VISIWETNALGEKQDVPEGPWTPPLTLAKMKAIEFSPIWRTKLDPEYVKQAEKLFKPDRPTVNDLRALEEKLRHKPKR
jgi:hypothetical protein